MKFHLYITILDQFESYKTFLMHGAIQYIIKSSYLHGYAMLFLLSTGDDDPRNDELVKKTCAE